MPLCGDAELKYLMTCFNMPVFAKIERNSNKCNCFFSIYDNDVFL